MGGQADRRGQTARPVEQGQPRTPRDQVRGRHEDRAPRRPAAHHARERGPVQVLTHRPRRTAAAAAPPPRISTSAVNPHRRFSFVRARESVSAASSFRSRGAAERDGFGAGAGGGTTLGAGVGAGLDDGVGEGAGEGLGDEDGLGEGVEDGLGDGGREGAGVRVGVGVGAGVGLGGSGFGGSGAVRQPAASEPASGGPERTTVTCPLRSRR
ncbi:hypothetical protein BB31_38905 [Amycolatopsis lurida NRRL 2430]|uniref:Uncharacterized protein n=1 Tax=Amycolatopsis lurida NRRL 2430 TaxID=1460371 RepID=A0A2P2FGQ6_AMYLU|nr:hypothetical protein BB31_38905 [Amycolatopsis lurida NRRL 2430]